MLLLFAIIGLTILAIISWLLWHFAKFEWLDKITTGLVLSLPFERIPSLQIAGANLRIGQILIIIGIWVVVVLLAKKDEKLLQVRLNPISYLLLGFIILSIPSWFFVIDSKRFLVTQIATLLCFGAVFLLSNFSENIYSKLRKLVYVFIGVSLFGLYQFFGDLIGIPPLFTGLRQQYTKIVFGIPRVQATALEPLYFAGMMLLPIIFVLVHIFVAKSVLKTKFKGKIINFELLGLFILIFLLTLSKGAYLALVLSVIVLIAYGARKLQVSLFLKWAKNILLVVSSLLFLGILFFENFRLIAFGIINNFIATFTFQFASSLERLAFLEGALVLLPNFIITGLGSGQYGAWMQNEALGGILSDPNSYLIVNNVYLEVWLEFGFLAFLVFMMILLWPVLKNIKLLNHLKSWNSGSNLARLTLIFALIASYIQWITFSPIFIMPIFIMIGLLANLAEKTEYEDSID